MLLRLAFGATARLPLRASHALGRVLGEVLFRSPNALRSAVRANLRTCFPELEPHEYDALVRESLHETGKTAAEIGSLWQWEPQRVLALVRAVSGEELLGQALSQGRGVLLAGPHLGAWELVGLYCAQRCPMTSLYRPLRIEGLRRYVLQARERTGGRLVAANAQGLRAVQRALGRGEAVGILPDQVPKRGKGVFAPFFGVPAYTMGLLPRLAARYRAPVLFTFARRLPDASGFHLYFLEAPEGIDDPEIPHAAAALNRGVERCVRTAPAQYQWTYRRFRPAPPGTPDLYRPGSGPASRRRGRQ